MISDLLKIFLRGIVLALLYLETTKANDTTPKNIFYFVSFYTIMYSGASIVDIDPMVVTTAFITKTVFTVVDERVKKKEESK
jgi:hypothetical protein